MKKAVPFYSLMMIFFTAPSQTLTQVFNEPVAGDLEYVLTADTSAYKSGLPVSGGNNMTWDLELLKTSPASETVKYLNPAGVPSASLYAGCSFVMDRPLYFGYFKSDQSGNRTVLLGLSTSTLSLQFTDPAVIREYPMSFGYSNSDFVSGQFDAGIVTGFCAGTSETSADGAGTLKLTGGRTYNDVLRVKTVMQLTLTAGILPVGNVEQTLIMFYHSSNKFPMLSLSYTKLQVMGGPAQMVTDHSINALQPTTIEELSDKNTGGISLYPNPANTTVHVYVPQTQPRVVNAEIYDTNGRLYDATNTGKFDVTEQQNGTYLVKIILADGSILWRKFLKF